jgi:hypothetical protein
MAYAIQASWAATWGLHGRERLVARVDLVNRSRELILGAFNSLLLRHAIEPELMRELRDMEVALSAAGSSAHAPVLVEPRPPPSRWRQ